MAAAFLANFLFWIGVALGGIVFAALVEVCGGRWPGPLRLTAERFGRFVPIALALFVVLVWRRADVYPWARSTGGDTRLREWLVAVRDAIALAAIYACAVAFCRASARARQNASAPSPARSAILLLAVYAVGFSLLAVDLIMSLEPRWTSTLFPAYVFTGNVYAGTAAVATVSAWDGPDATAAAAARTRDMANLLVGIALFWTYLFWSQFLVIWYGNVTAEVGFMMARVGTTRALGWVVLALCSAVPTIALVPQRGKDTRTVKIVAPAILLGLWLERWLLVAPDLPSQHAVFAALGMTAAFGAAFVWAIRRQPASMRSG